MTKKEVVAEFKETILPGIKETEKVRGYRDLPMRSEAWSNFVDTLYNDGKVTDSQAFNWSQPACCN